MAPDSGSGKRSTGPPSGETTYGSPTKPRIGPRRPRKRIFPSGVQPRTRLSGPIRSRWSVEGYQVRRRGAPPAAGMT